MAADWGPILKPTDIGLVLSYQCRLSCKHCVYNCGPGWQEWMTPDKVWEALTNITSLGDHLQIHITGGEPFLNFPLLVQAVTMAKELNIPRYVETDAAWCANRQVARERFFRLKEAGLQAILISCSPFHAEYIPLLYTVIAIETAAEVFAAQNVYIAEVDWLEQISRFSINEPIPIQRYSQAYGHDPAGLLFWESYPLISGGRAGYELGDFTERLPASAFANENCEMELLFPRHAHLDPYGNFTPEYCGGLSSGSWYDLYGLQTRYRQGDYPGLIALLVTGGPFALYQLSRRRYGYHPLASGYAGKCHLCVDVRRHLACNGSFPELQPANFYQCFSQDVRDLETIDHQLSCIQPEISTQPQADSGNFV